jgi:hypothetical protein
MIDVAWLALIVALAGLAWNIIATIMKLPRLHAELNKTAFVTAISIGASDVTEDARATTQFHVTALNTGSEAVTIWDAGLMRVDGSGVASVRDARANDRTVDGPELPARVESHGTLTWTFPDELSRDVPDDEELFGWVSRYRPLRKLRMSKAAAERRARQWTSGKTLPRKFRASSRTVYRSSRGSVRGAYSAPSK